MEDYLELRRGLGFRLVNYGAWLREFVSFLEKNNASHITTALAVQFALRDPHQEAKAQASRYSAVRGFASCRSGVDPATEIPPRGLVRGRTRRARPYLYSDQEVCQLLQAARQLPSTYSLRPWTYYCLFGLLAVTGLRLGEALDLQCQDIDWAEGVLTIRRTKFGKSRLVPLHASTVKVLAAVVDQALSSRIPERKTRHSPDNGALRDAGLHGDPTKPFFNERSDPRTLDALNAITGCSLRVCPVCHQGRMLVIEILPRSPHRKKAITDTS